MLDAELCAWLALHNIPKLPDAALRRLIAYTSDPKEIISLEESILLSLKITPATQQALRSGIDHKKMAKSLEVIKSLAITVLPICHDDYPLLLKQISDPPPILYIRGDPTLLNQPQLAMVGSRRSSKQGKENASRFAAEFAQNGFTVTSGLALGIDAECHRGALSVNGNTVAVLGTGVDIVYPSSNQQLYDQLIEHGAIVSEFPLGTTPKPYLFPQRNRVISGMSLGVLVVEAALKSGSLITARCALEQGREVFAIPNSIHNPAGRGCHALIKQGAKLVESTTDIMEELNGWLLTAHDISNDESNSLEISQNLNVQGFSHSVRANDNEINLNQKHKLSSKEKDVIDLLGFDPASIDLLQQRCGWSLAELSSVLITLELKGLVENIAGSYQRLY